jgi:hypothetical protein
MWERCCRLLSTGYLIENVFYIKFEVSKAVTMENAALWDVVPCKYCVNRRFGGTYRLHLQGTKIRVWGTSVSKWLQPPEIGFDTFLRNVGLHNIYTAPHSRSRHSSYIYFMYKLKFKLRAHSSKFIWFISHLKTLPQLPRLFTVERGEINSIYDALERNEGNVHGLHPGILLERREYHVIRDKLFIWDSNQMSRNCYQFGYLLDHKGVENIIRWFLVLHRIRRMTNQLILWLHGSVKWLAAARQSRTLQLY